MTTNATRRRLTVNPTGDVVGYSRLHPCRVRELGDYLLAESPDATNAVS